VVELPAPGVLGNGGNRRHDPAVGPNAEELLAAWVAAVGRQRQQTLQEIKGSPVDPVAGDPIEIEISASPAVGVAHEPHSHAAGMKAVVARVTPPWP